MRAWPVCTFALLVSASVCFAQPDAVWSRHYGGTAEEICHALIQTADSGFALLGRTASFGAGGSDFYLVRTDTAGTELWSRAYGSPNNDYGYAVRQTADGGFLLAGSSVTATGNWNVWLVRTDAAGDTLWTKNMGGAGTDECHALLPAADGGFVGLGRSTSYSNGSEDFWFFKLSDTGDSLWSRHYGGSRSDIGWAIAPAADGGYLLVGQTQSYGPSPSSWPNYWAVRVSVTGDSLWSRADGGAGGDWAYAAAGTPDGGFLMGGTATFTPGNSDAWLLRLAASGDSVWSRTFGGAVSDQGSAVMVDAEGRCYIAGSKGTPSNFLLAATNAAGDSLWTRTYGGTASDKAYAALIATDRAVVMAGGSYSFPNAGQDFYLVKTQPLPLELPAIDVMPETLTFLPTVAGDSRSAQLTIRNVSAVNLELRGVSMPGGFVAATGGILAPGQETTMVVVFLPTQAGPYSGTLTVHSTAASGDSVTGLAGLAVSTPAETLRTVQILTTALGFGDVVVGQDSTLWVRVDNIGYRNVTVSGFSTPLGFSAVANGNSVLTPGDSLQVLVTFSPTQVQAYGGNLVVHSNADAGDSVVALAGTGLAGQPEIAVRPDTVAFGDVHMGYTFERSVYLRNTGNAPLVVTAVGVPAPFANDFEGPVELAPGAEDTVEVLLTPQATVEYVEPLIVHSNAVQGDSTLVLTGRGVTSMIDVSPDTLNFGEVALNEAVADTMRITNAGTLPITLQGLTLPHGYSAGGPVTGPLAPGAERMILVQFSPDTVGDYRGQLRVLSNAAFGANTIYLMGRAYSTTAGEPPAPLPTEFTLTAQPNPFNLVTQLAFELPRAARVRLEIFDVTGRVVCVLADAPYAAGRYAVPFVGAALPSGVYLARLNAGPVTLTQKLVLLK